MRFKQIWLGVVAACAVQVSWADEMGDLDGLLDVAKPAAQEGASYFGFVEFSAARAYEDPEHWSKLRARTNLGASGRLGDAAKWKLSGRLDVDAARDLEDDIYPSAVRRDQRLDAMIREAYVDFAAGGLDYRVGRQHVVWGEMVGLFFADVVSARDLREFILPEFDQMRTPQWAVRAEHFGEDFHLEGLWIPFPSYDDIGRPGAEFYPFPVTDGVRINGEEKPTNRLGNMNWGLRASALVNGWDFSGFYYRSTDVQQTFYRSSVSPLTFTPKHERIRQIGATFSKDFGQFVLKGEAVHTHGRKFNSDDPLASDGLVESGTAEYVIGVDVPVGTQWRFNAQYFGRTFFDHDDGMFWDEHEQGVTLLVNHTLRSDLEAEVLVVAGLNHSDYMVRPKLVWQVSPEWKATTGVDVFGGDEMSFFGRYDDKDRVYAEVKRSF